MGPSDPCGHPHILRRVWCVATPVITSSVAFVVLSKESSINCDSQFGVGINDTPPVCLLVFPRSWHLVMSSFTVCAPNVKMSRTILKVQLNHFLIYTTGMCSQLFSLFCFLFWKFLYIILWSQSLLNYRYPSHNLLAIELPLSYSTYHSVLTPYLEKKLQNTHFFSTGSVHSTCERIRT